MRSRFVRGFVAGLLAAIPAVLWGYLARYGLRLSHNLFRNFISVLILGKTAVTTLEAGFTQLVQLGFMGGVGSLSALFIYWTGEDGIHLKSMILATAVWFIIYTFGTAFRIPVMYRVDLGTAFSHLVGALIFGAVWPPAMSWLEPETVDLPVVHQPVPWAQVESRMASPGSLFR